MEEKILELIANKQYGELRKQLSEMNPADIAVIFEEIPEKELAVIFRILPKELAAEVFVEIDSDMQQLLIEAFSDKELREVMDELFMDDTVDIIDEMPASVAKRILKQTDAATRKMINHLLAYPDECAGSIMTTEYIDLKKDMTVDEAFDRIRKIGFDTETIYNCYVTDRSRHLLGIVTVKDLLLNKKDCIINDIMEENIIYANTLDDQEEVVGLFEKYDVLALPVVDKENRLVGIITVDDAIDVMQEEASEDIEKMAAILPSEKTYLKTGVFETFKARIPWLLFLMISATFTGAVISGYEDKLTQFAALIAFIPMLMGTGGNSGSQSSVTVIRALSLGDIEFEDIWRVIWKELRVSLVSGIVLGAVNFIKIYLIDYLLLNNLDKSVALPEMIIVCLTLVLVVIVAKLVGCILPILAKRINLDPAVMASPLVTTILDAFSLMIYFGIASVVLGV
ncbi:MAG: magnesium transporter [Clostridia bacterium]|nr:magnesium transporter [Clostridia bacterium]MEE1185235.1 magnesium transporter [Acutalibacteraceae bacterium]